MIKYKTEGRGCDDFDYNYLYFKYIITKTDLQRAETESRDDEMREKRIGPYQKFVPRDIKFLSGWTIRNFDGKSYWIMNVGGLIKDHKTLKEVMKDPHYKIYVTIDSTVKDDLLEYSDNVKVLKRLIYSTP